MTNLTLLPSQNTFVSSGKPDTNFSSSNILYSGVDSKGSIQRAMLSFDLSLLPVDIVIESAVLKLYADYSTEKNKGGFFTPYIIISSWDEQEVTWDTQPLINQSIAGKTVEVSSYGWYIWDITSIVQIWILNGSNNHGLLIKSIEDNLRDIKKFHSMRSFYYRSYRPSLEIKYSFKNIFSIGSRNTVNAKELYETGDEIAFSAWQNNSTYSMYTFFVQNTGVHPIQVFVQISPDRKVVVDEQAVFNIAPGTAKAVVPQIYGFFTRLAYKSYFSGSRSSLKVWFQAQV